jgi:hypothetical protein
MDTYFADQILRRVTPERRQTASYRRPSA